MKQINRKPFGLCVTLFALLVFSRSASACICLEADTQEQKYADAENIVIMKLVSMEKLGGSEKYWQDDRYRKPTLVVERVFKGELKVGDKLSFQQGSGIDCIWKFKDKEIGNKYLLYLNEPEKDQSWYVFSCSGSRLLDEAEENLTFLNALPKTPTLKKIKPYIDVY